jgi:predicted aminopeptidase
MAVLAARKPIADLIKDPSTPEKLKKKLKLAEKLRQFAVDRLKLPDSGSYRDYADLGREDAAYVVIATPEFSIKPKTFCFPAVGCLSYIGFFDQEQAIAFNRKLKSEGYDTYLDGTPAYSTLGWFDDPLLNTYIQWPEDRLAALIFHEMAHEKMYVDDDTDFNESFAEAMAHIGVRRWFLYNDMPQRYRAYARHEQLKDTFHQLVASTRQQLAELYDNAALSPSEKRTRKKENMAALILRYRTAAAGYPKEPPYLAWMKQGLNNAKLSTISTYSRWVPAFMKLYRKSGYQLDKFHIAVKKLSEQSASERRRWLDLFLKEPSPPPADRPEQWTFVPNAKTTTAQRSLFKNRPRG